MPEQDPCLGEYYSKVSDLLYILYSFIITKSAAQKAGNLSKF